MTEIKVNNETLDLGNLDPIPYTVQANTIGDLSNRQASFTQTINIPKTDKNNRILGFVDSVQNLSFDQYSIYNIDVFTNGVPIIQGGLGILEGIGNSFELTVYSSLKSFYNEIDGKDLYDLNLGSLDHNWTQANITDSFNNTSGYIYPLTNWGVFSKINSTIDSRFQRPYIYLHTLVSQICTDIGYTQSGSFWNDPFYRSLLVTDTGKVFSNQDAFLDQFSFNFQAQSPKDYVLTPPISSGTYSNYQGPSIIGISSYTATNSLTLDIFGAIKVTQFERFDVSTAINTQLVVRKNGAVIGTATNFLSTGDYSVEIQGQSVVSGDVLTLEVIAQITRNPLSPNPRTEYRIQNASFATTEVQREIDFGNTVNFQAYTPNFSQTDLLKAVSNLFGLVYESDPLAKTFTARRMNELIENIPNAKDWSKKLIPNAREAYISRSFHPEAYAQFNYFRYKEDDTVRNGYGDAFLQISDANLNGSIDKVSLPFASSESIETVSGQPVAKIDVYRLDGTEMVEENKPEARIVYKGANLSNKIYSDGATTSTAQAPPVASFNTPGDAQTLDFNSMLATGYGWLSEFVDRYEKVRARFQLYASDISQFDTFTPVYVKQLNGYFYVEKISNWVSYEKPVEVELVKIR